MNSAERAPHTYCAVHIRSTVYSHYGSYLTPNGYLHLLYLGSSRSDSDSVSVSRAAVESASFIVYNWSLKPLHGAMVVESCMLF